MTLLEGVRNLELLERAEDVVELGEHFPEIGYGQIPDRVPRQLTGLALYRLYRESVAASSFQCSNVNVSDSSSSQAPGTRPLIAVHLGRKGFGCCSNDRAVLGSALTPHCVD